MSNKKTKIITEVEYKKTDYRSILRKVKSKEHFMFIFGEKGDFYLPPISYITFKFIKKVLSGEKSLLPNDELKKSFNFPKRKGFNFVKYYRSFMKMPTISMYFPDLTRNQHPPKEFFFDVSINKIMKSKFPDQFRKIEKELKKKPKRKNVKIIDKNLYITKQHQELLDSVSVENLEFLLCKDYKINPKNLNLFPNTWKEDYSTREKNSLT